MMQWERDGQLKKQNKNGTKLKAKVEKIQLYSCNNLNMGELFLFNKRGKWEWNCACGHHNYSKEALREIANLIEEAESGKLKVNQKRKK